ncbi:YncE family protein [Chloroflexi bacterium TSY]|nr:YncE family protein [Chloroflexi bacterium TSY]
MFHRIRTIVLGLLLVVSLLPVSQAQATVNASNPIVSSEEGKIVVANRNSGTISVIDVDTDEVVQTVPLPGPNPPEPMYVVYVRQGHQVYVGDRANNRVVSFDGDTFDVLGTVPTGEGVFHMWADDWGKQLWVNNDVDNTVTVINPRSREVIETVPMPADLVEDNGKPHDVILSPIGRSAFVTMVNVNGENDFVVKFNTRTFRETARAAVGKDPHLSLILRSNRLYVPTQNADQVTVLRRSNLSLITNISVPAAHGAGMRRDGQVFYTTNITGGGPAGLVAIDIKPPNANRVLGAVDTPFPTPHNIALTPDGLKIYVTHSGANANQVSVYHATRQQPVPVLDGFITVELNPFGLTYVP